MGEVEIMDPFLGMSELKRLKRNYQYKKTVELWNMIDNIFEKSISNNPDGSDLDNAFSEITTLLSDLDPISAAINPQQK